MPEQFTTQWSVKYKTLNYDWDSPQQSFRTKFRNPGDDQLMSEESARAWALDRNSAYGPDAARVYSRRVTEWVEANPKPEPVQGEPLLVEDE